MLPSGCSSFGGVLSFPPVGTGILPDRAFFAADGDSFYRKRVQRTQRTTGSDPAPNKVPAGILTIDMLGSFAAVCPETWKNGPKTHSRLKN
jgi:hypothetical protein